MSDDTKQFRAAVYALRDLPPHSIGLFGPRTECGVEYEILRTGGPTTDIAISRWIEAFAQTCALHPRMRLVWRIEPEIEKFWGPPPFRCYGRFAFVWPKAIAA